VAIPPPPDVVGAFGGTGVPSLMPGGRGSSWRCGDVVLKPADATEEELAWRATLVSDSGIRLARPLPSRAGRYVARGWMASRFLAGEHRPRSWLQVIAAGDTLHAALAALPRPSSLDARSDPWAIADRLAWDEAVPTGPTDTVERRLGSLRRPVPLASQLVHGDLTGNVLFADGLPPAILDLSLYWRPTDYATAIVVVDALTWEDATVADVEPVLGRAWFGQLLIRALLFRLHAAALRGDAALQAEKSRAGAAISLANELHA
jgi:uncharacterized protein (TIGR02569 family)